MYLILNSTLSLIKNLTLNFKIYKIQKKKKKKLYKNSKLNIVICKYNWSIDHHIL